MQRRIGRPSLSYANVVATLALFVALGGGAYAAVTVFKANKIPPGVRAFHVTRQAVPFGTQPVASVSVPAGSYAVVAKIWVAHQSAAERIANCSLSVGPNTDQSVEAVGPGGATVAMTTAGRLRKRGAISVSSQPDTVTPPLEARVTSITATRVASVTDPNAGT